MSDHEKIVKLAQSGTRPIAIAARLRCHPNTVYGVLRNARRNGVKIPEFETARSAEPEDVETPSTRKIAVPVRVFSLLEKLAERKGMTTTEAAQRLLEDALLAGSAVND